jgi:hypothetical protein
MPDSADLSRVTALAHKGVELTLKGHDARAAEKLRLAAEEAEQVLPDPDGLVMCVLRVQQLEALLGHATASAAEPADADDALREACLRLLPSVMAVLERRKAAGTLLPGSCRPVEETYQLDVMRHNVELQGGTRALAAENAAILAPYVGVETYFRAAASVAFLLNNMNTLTLKHAFVLSNEHIDAGFQFLVSALDLMALPRDLDRRLRGEPAIVNQLRELIPVVRNIDTPAIKKLCAAWRHVLRSGVLRARGIENGIDKIVWHDERKRAAAEADLAAGRLQQCALASCTARESHASQFKRCGACRAVCYCSREHQVEDWPSHKVACKAARKAAADPAGASNGGE